MLEAFDLTRSLRDAGELSGVSHHTVARYVAAREAGALSDQPEPRAQLVDEFLPKLEEWIERSEGKLRADVAHDKLLVLGYTGRRRLRETLHRDQLELAPCSVRRADAQDPGHRDRGPAPAPRPLLSDHRRKRAPLPSPLRPRGEPLELAPQTVVASTGQIPWPPPGTSRDPHRAGLTTAPGQKPTALDIRCWSLRPMHRSVRPHGVGESPGPAVASASCRWSRSPRCHRLRHRRRRMGCCMHCGSLIFRP